MEGWVSLIWMATWSLMASGAKPRSSSSFRMSWAPADTMKYCWYTRSSRPASSLSSG